MVNAVELPLLSLLEWKHLYLRVNIYYQIRDNYSKFCRYTELLFTVIDLLSHKNTDLPSHLTRTRPLTKQPAYANVYCAAPLTIGKRVCV